jgi:hypothetical protein
VSTTRLDIEQEEFPVERHVFAGQERLYALVDEYAGFLPKKITHRAFL